MRDKRKSTPTNALVRGDEEGLAERLPKVLGARLRTARLAVQLSQGAAASAMAERGFSWRQTTVAKSEAADRPVLFAEVAALARIYRRPIEYFLNPGTELDDVLAKASEDLGQVQDHIASTRRVLAELQEELLRAECRVGLASSVVRYKNTRDSGVLLNDLNALLERFGARLLHVYEVYEAVGIDVQRVAKIDVAVLKEVARANVETIGGFEGEGLAGEVSEFLKALRSLLEGKQEEVRSTFLQVLREGPDWVNYVALQLADELMEAVHPEG